jgi:hypothetical protein
MIVGDISCGCSDERKQKCNSFLPQFNTIRLGVTANVPMSYPLARGRVITMVSLTLPPTNTNKGD